jgi:hypothetical protein
LHLQQYTQKNRAPRFARRIRPVRYAHGLDLSPRYARQELTGSLRSPKRARYAHTTQPHHLATLGHTSSLGASTLHLTRHTLQPDHRIGVDRHTRRLCLSARNARLCWHTLKLHMPTLSPLSKHTPHISGALEPHFVRRTPVPSRTPYVRAHGPYTTGGLPHYPLGGYIH